MKKIQKLILAKLEKDARTPFSRFKIRKSQQTISYAVHSLAKKGIIQQLYTLIDYAKLNILNFRVYFKVTYINEEKFHELTDYLKADHYTSWVATCGGRDDLICTFLTLNPSQFNKTLRRVMSKFPQQLRNYTVLTTVVSRGFGRKYLFKDFTQLPQLIYGGDRTPEKIDAVDMSILFGLTQDARKSSVKIAEQLDITPKTIIERIKKLQEREIIVGFKPLLDMTQLGYLSTLLVVRYHNISSEIENKFVKYLQNHPHVIRAVKTLGEWDIEIHLEVEGETQLRKIEMELRQKFTSLIQQIERIPIYQTHKKNLFPTFLLEG